MTKKVLTTKNWFQIAIDINLYIFSNYNETLEDLLKNKLKKLKDWAKKQESKLTNEQKEEFYDFYSEDHWQLSKTFPNILRSSLFVNCYSLFEHEIIGLCKYLYKKNKYKTKLKDIKDKGIFKAKKYLKKVGIKFPGQTPLWNEIVNYNRIRNFIVHNLGRLDNSKKATIVESFIKNKSWINLDENRRIQFQEGFLIKVKETIKNFSYELSKALP